MAYEYRRSTGTQRKREARAKVRYAHVSVEVGRKLDESVGLMLPCRTPQGSGSTYRKDKAA